MVSKRFHDSHIVADLLAAIETEGRTAFARRAGVSRTFVHQVEHGGRPPGPKIAAALGYYDDGKRWVRRET